MSKIIKRLKPKMHLKNVKLETKNFTIDDGLLYLDKSSGIPMWYVLQNQCNLSLIPENVPVKLKLQYKFSFCLGAGTKWCLKNNGAYNIEIIGNEVASMSENAAVIYVLNAIECYIKIIRVEADSVPMLKQNYENVITEAVNLKNELTKFLNPRINTGIKRI